MNDRELARTGPSGSGGGIGGTGSGNAAPSGPGRSGANAGLKHLRARQEARRNGHWEDLWFHGPKAAH